MEWKGNFDHVPDDALECLNTWPSGSVGEAEERQILRALNELCKIGGYGGVPSLAAKLEDLWRGGPERIAHHQKQQAERRAMLAECAAIVASLAAEEA